MRSFENWFGIPLRFFALAIFLSSPERSFNPIFSFFSLLSFSFLSFTSHVFFFSLKFFFKASFFPFLHSDKAWALIREHWIYTLIIIFGVQTAASTHTHTHTARATHMYGVYTDTRLRVRESFNLMSISLFVCTMAFKRLPFAFHTMRLPHNILYFIVVDGFHWALKEMETTKYFSVNQSQWIIREHIYYIRPLGATISMVSTSDAEPETRPRPWTKQRQQPDEEEWGKKMNWYTKHIFAFVRFCLGKRTN